MAGVLPGRIRQNGYVVPDLDAAMTHWTEVLGVGPWFPIRNITLGPSVYRGAPATTEISLAVANSGDLQIELIEAHDDSPSVFGEFIEASSSGLHHLAWWTDEFDAAVDRADAAGWEVIQSGDLMGTRFCYFDTEAHQGTVAELMELNDMSRWLADRANDAAANWDGVTDPIRTLT
jgi:catechol 2,3-dioxygenase-like lactoylglutathione lyase family enzyme